ncbi:hypothetical protein ON010_g16504 [Phytophthora cinnamomi]|nr:hypothetical protein ON010_g16504 [Phytophthora cinnamomi]
MRVHDTRSGLLKVRRVSAQSLAARGARQRLVEFGHDALVVESVAAAQRCQRPLGRVVIGAQPAQVQNVHAVAAAEGLEAVVAVRVPAVARPTRGGQAAAAAVRAIERRAAARRLGEAPEVLPAELVLDRQVLV